MTHELCAICRVYHVDSAPQCVVRTENDALRAKAMQFMRKRDSARSECEQLDRIRRDLLDRAPCECVCTACMQCHQ